MTAVIVSEIFLYFCICLLWGSFILAAVPERYKPIIMVRKRTMMFAVAGIAVFSFVPLFILVANLKVSLGLQASIQSVLLTFEIGKAWIFTAIVDVVLLLFIWRFYPRRPLVYPVIGCLLTFLLVAGMAWSSHAASLEEVAGFAADSAHLTAVGVWIGVLLVVSWFSKNEANWLPFLRWYTPVALISVLMTLGSGLMMMSYVMDLSHYPDTWFSSYGQLLLWKHVWIISLLAFAGINSLLIRKRLKKGEGFSPTPWMRAESAAALIIFSLTAALSEQAPPNSDEDRMTRLFEFFYQGQYTPGMQAQLSMDPTSISLFVLAFLLLALMFYAFLKKASAVLTFFLSVLFAFSCYFAFVLSLD